MPPQTHHLELQGWQRLVGRWATEATHPGLPGTVITGRATFEWLEDSQRFTHTLSDDDNTINGQGELSTNDGATWEPDLTITYCRTG